MASQQQPAARPWFRLASMARPAPTVPTPAPAPAPTPQAQPPAPQPRPPFLRPTFVTPTPQPQPQPPPPSQPTPPPQAAQPPPPTTTTTLPVPRSPVVPTSTPSPTDSTSLPIASASVPSSPKPRASVPSSPAPKSVPSPPQAREPPQLASPILIRPPAPALAPAPAPVQLASPILIRPLAPAPAQLASPILIRPSALAPAPAAVQQLVSAPPISTTAKPASPSPAPPPISTTAKPVSPTPVRVGVVAAAPTTTTVTTQVPSPKIVKPTKTESPSPMAPRAEPPSPLILPPSQLMYGVQQKQEQRQKIIPPEAEQKTVLVQETTEKPKAKPNGFGIYNNNNNAPTGKPDATKVDKGNHKKLSSDSEDFGMRIVTVAGENRGAIMELSPSRNNNNNRFGFGGKPQSLQNPPGTTSTNGEKYVSSSTGEEGRPKIKDKNGKAITKTTSSPPLNAFMNSNVQSVNNSILYNTSCTYHDPGVHLSLSRKSNGARNAPGINIRDRLVNAQNGSLRQREG